MIQRFALFSFGPSTYYDATNSQSYSYLVQCFLLLMFSPCRARICIEQSSLVYCFSVPPPSRSLLLYKNLYVDFLFIARDPPMMYFKGWRWIFYMEDVSPGSVSAVAYIYSFGPSMICVVTVGKSGLSPSPSTAFVVSRLISSSAFSTFSAVARP